MGREKDRFERVYSQGAMNVMEIWVDKETGVNYVFHASGYAGGMTPLLDREGKPVVSPIHNRQKYIQRSLSDWKKNQKINGLDGGIAL